MCNACRSKYVCTCTRKSMWFVFLTLELPNYSINDAMPMLILLFRSTSINKVGEWHFYGNKFKAHPFCLHLLWKENRLSWKCDSSRPQIYHLLYEFYHQNKFAFNCIAKLIWNVHNAFHISIEKNELSGNCVWVCACARVWIELNWIEVTEFCINSLNRTQSKHLA